MNGKYQFVKVLKNVLYFNSIMKFEFSYKDLIMRIMFIKDNWSAFLNIRNNSNVN